MTMAIIEADAFYLPEYFRAQVKVFRTEVYQDEGVAIHLKIPQISRSFLQTLTDSLKKRREAYLACLPIGKIIDVLDQASRRWLEKDYPLRELALKTIPTMTHFSREVVEASIDAEMESSLRKTFGAPSVWRSGILSFSTIFNTLQSWGDIAGPLAQSSSSPFFLKIFLPSPIFSS